jgi:hypothetical protein
LFFFLLISTSPLGAWAFCWIANGYVLLGFFFAPAGLIMCFNLGISLYLAWMILGVRAKTRGLTRHTVREVLGLFFTVNSGSIACGMLALLFFAYSDNPLSYLSLVTGILFLLQAVSLWIVFFARRENLALWGLLITGQWRDRQRLLSSVSTDSNGPTGSKQTGEGESSQPSNNSIAL